MILRMKKTKARHYDQTRTNDKYLEEDWTNFTYTKQNG